MSFSENGYEMQSPYSPNDKNRHTRVSEGEMFSNLQDKAEMARFGKKQQLKVRDRSFIRPLPSTIDAWPGVLMLRDHHSEDSAWCQSSD